MKNNFFLKAFNNLKKSPYFSHKTKFTVVKKFFFVLLIILFYGFFMIRKFGMEDGLLVTFLSWSFFVFCTPIADAGFLLDFPIRLITHIRMLYSEISVWILATIGNLIIFFTKPELYDKNELLIIFKDILTHPWPFWSIIFLSAIGTFLSVIFGDELIDVETHEEREKYHKHHLKYKLIILLTLFCLIMFFYYYLLNKFNISF